MKILGEKIFAKDSEGRLISRIGTMFLRTKVLVQHNLANYSIYLNIFLLLLCKE